MTNRLPLQSLQILAALGSSNLVRLIGLVA